MNSLILFLALGGVGGDIINMDGLTPIQKAELQMKHAELLEKSGSEKNVEKVREWAELGQSVGVALVATAKELGIAVDDFAQTGVGKVTIGVLVWKIMGKEVTRVVVSIIYLISGVWLWNVYFRKMCIVKSISYETNSKKVSKIEHWGSESNQDGLRFCMFLALAAILASGFLIMLL